MSEPGLTAADIVQQLDLRPHPEGGHYRETFRDRLADADGRAASTAIFYLLAAGEVSHWHRVDAAEVWHFYAGAPLMVEISATGEEAEALLLGQNLSVGERPQVVVPAGVWQSARSLGAYTLVGCTVAPGFVFEGFEMAPAGWRPGAGPPNGRAT